MQLEKYFISLYLHSFERIEDYLVCVKELQLKLGECGNNFQNKYGQLIKLVLVNLKTPFDVLCSMFQTNYGRHAKNVVRNIPLILYVAYWLMINICCLMKGSLVVNIKLTCSRVKDRWIIRKEDVPMLLYANKNVLNRKIKWRLMIRHPPGTIKRGKHVCTVERLDMWRKVVGRRAVIQKWRLSNLKEMCQLSIDQSTILPFKSEPLKHCFHTPIRMSGYLILGALIIWPKMLLYYPP